ncbi:protein FAM76A-like isoform X3 [Ornithodoros turicata]|uniref:protein FAM76A-like isoform X3 n=1 Tax=Ornithodoros turicata TaxID=34597 RepID=UPI003139992C
MQADENVYIRYARLAIYAGKTALGYSAPFIWAPLVTNHVFNEASRTLFVLIIIYVQLLLGTVHPGAASVMVFFYLPFLELNRTGDLDLHYFSRNTCRRMNDASLRELVTSSGSGQDDVVISEELEDELFKLERMRQTALIGVGFAATIGNFGYISGHALNYYVIGMIEQDYKYVGVSAKTWFLFHFPLCLVQVIFIWSLLTYLKLGKQVESKQQAFIDGDVRHSVKEQIRGLGPVTLVEHINEKCLLTSPLDCRGAFPIVKCTYCRTEFQQENNKGGTICRKCEQNVKAYGKPTACEYCNIIAAFIGSKCQRCTNSEKRYGPPVTCEQCKQRCAFDRKDDSRRKVDGKLLCWLCTLSYKRALAKAKQNDRHSSLGKTHHHRSSSQNHHKGHKSSSESKRPRLDPAANGSMPLNRSSTDGLLDPNSSDHVVALTQLREQVSSLQKQMTLKDQQLLAKDKQIAELKAHMSSADREARNKLQLEQKKHSQVVQELTNKLRALQKQVVAKSKNNRKAAIDSPSLIT